MRPHHLVLLSICVAVRAASADAQPAASAPPAARPRTTELSAADQAIALALFSEGKELAAQHDLARACAKFEAADRLTHWLGVELNLADCYDRLGRTASAWIVFLKAADHADGDHDPRGPYARERARSLEPLLARVALSTTAALHPGLEIRIDHVALAGSALGIALPLDPGEHVIEVTAPGHTAWTHHLSLAPGTTIAVALPALAPLQRTATSRRWYRTLALWLGAGGAVLAGTSLALGLDAKLSYDAATRDHCDTRLACDPTGLEEISTARRNGNIATAAGGLGLAAITTAVVLYVVSPRERAHESSIAVIPVATPSSLGLVLEGRL